MPRQMNPNTVVDFFPVLEPLSSSDAIIVMTMLLYSSKSFSSKGAALYKVVVPFVGNAIIKGVYVSPQKMKLKKQKRDVCVRLLALSPPGGGLEECSSSSSSRDDPFLTRRFVEYLRRRLSGQRKRILLLLCAKVI